MLRLFAAPEKSVVSTNSTWHRGPGPPQLHGTTKMFDNQLHTYSSSNAGLSSAFLSSDYGMYAPGKHQDSPSNSNVLYMNARLSYLTLIRRINLCGNVIRTQTTGDHSPSFS